MAKKRRKLNKDFEKKIYSSKKNVELVLAKIYDIDDEDIQKEYMSAFNKVVFLYFYWPFFHLTINLYHLLTTK